VSGYLIVTQLKKFIADFNDYTDYTDDHLIREIREIRLICVSQLAISN